MVEGDLTCMQALIAELEGLSTGASTEIRNPLVTTWPRYFFDARGWRRDRYCKAIKPNRANRVPK